MIPTLTQHGSAVPALGFGTWALREHTAVEMVAAALDAGYRHIDTAQMYANETEVGKAIRESGVPRGEIFLTTKIGKDQLQKAVFTQMAHQSLERLGMDYVDLLLIHWPNPAVPLEETLEAMQTVQQAGLCRHVGVSNFPVALLQRTLDFGLQPFTNQVEYHPLLDQQKLQGFMQKQGILLTAYSPIAQGKVIDNPVIKSLAEKYGKHETQISLRWLLQQEGVMAIPRSSKARNIKANMDLFDFALSEAEMAQISALGSAKGRLVNPPDGPDWD